MSGVEFNEPQLAKTYSAAQKSSLLVRFVMGMGLAKDAKGAQKVLVIIALLLMGVALYVLVTGVFGSVQAPPNEAEVMRG